MSAHVSDARSTAARSIALPLLATWIVLAGLGCSSGSEPTGPPSVVLVTLDTTRVDHLSSYGYDRPTSPNLDALAERSVRFRHAWSTSSWTLPAHASLFTGLHPSRHGAHYDPRGDARLGEIVRFPIAAYVRAGMLGDGIPTLAEWLAGHGYRTGAFVAGPWLNRTFGLLQGFETRDDAVEGFGGRPADEISDRAIAWLAGIPEGEPYFLFANYFDPHAPYDPREAYPEMPRAGEPFKPDYDALMRGEKSLDADERAVLRDRYDAEIRWMDGHFGRLVDAVLARGDGEHTLVIVTADHGEALGEEDRFGHGFWLTEELVRVPFVVRLPGDRDGGTWNDAPVSVVDVWPLVAAEIGLEPPGDLEGLPLGERTVVFAELHKEQTTALRFGDRYDRGLDTAIAWPHKLERSDDGRERLSVLSSERLVETRSDDEAARGRLAQALDEFASARPAAEIVSPEVDLETVEALRRLGYVD